MLTTLYWVGETPLVKLTGKYHCGTLPANRFKYEVTLVGHKLDSVTGFLADNAIIGQWFDNLHETDESCERIVQRAARDFLASDANITSVIVRLWGVAGQAYAEVTADRSDLAD